MIRQKSNVLALKRALILQAQRVPSIWPFKERQLLEKDSTSGEILDLLAPEFEALFGLRDEDSLSFDQDASSSHLSYDEPHLSSDSDSKI